MKKFFITLSVTVSVFLGSLFSSVEAKAQTTDFALLAQQILQFIQDWSAWSKQFDSLDEQKEVFENVKNAINRVIDVVYTAKTVTTGVKELKEISDYYIETVDEILELKSYINEHGSLNDLQSFIRMEKRFSQNCGSLINASSIVIESVKRMKDSEPIEYLRLVTDTVHELRLNVAYHRSSCMQAMMTLYDNIRIDQTVADNEAFLKEFYQ